MNKVQLKKKLKLVREQIKALNFILIFESPTNIGADIKMLEERKREIQKKIKEVESNE